MVKKEKTVQEKETTQENEKINGSTNAAPAENNVSKVGNLLKEMRQRKGLKIADIAKRLCIRRCYLEAIEESDYKEMPEFPYGIGFIRSYAEFLGLNSENIIELYKTETNTNQDKDIYVLEPQTEATVPSKKYLLASLAAIAAVYAAWQAYSQKSVEQGIDENPVPAAIELQSEENSEDLPLIVEDYSTTPVTIENQSEEIVIAEPAADGNSSQIMVTDESFVESEAPQDSEEIAKAEAPKPETVVFKIKAETWIEVKDASKLYLSKVLMPGDTYTVPEGKGMIVSSGKVEGVDVYINGVLTPVFTNRKKMNVPLDNFIKTSEN